MYDDLAKRLRYAASYDERIVIETCKEAADAIEELTGFVQEAERDRDEYRERLDKANDTIEELAKDNEILISSVASLRRRIDRMKSDASWDEDIRRGQVQGMW